MFTRKQPRLVLSICVFAFLAACAPENRTDFQAAPRSTSVSGMVVVANTGSRSVLLYDSGMNFVKILRQYTAAAGDAPASLAVFDSTSILVAVEGVDRIEKIDVSTGAVEAAYIVDSNLTGTMKGLTRLSGGEILVSDATTGAHLERYVVGSIPQRVTTGWPMTLLNTAQALFPLTANQFLACAAGTSQVVRTYSAAGVQTGSASATAPVPSLGAAHNATGCVADSSGRIAVAWNGATDSVRMYNSTLTTTVWTYNNAILLANPVAMTIRPNNNILVADGTNNLIIELNASGSYINHYTSAFFSTISAMVVMP